MRPHYCYSVLDLNTFPCGETDRVTERSVLTESLSIHYGFHTTLTRPLDPLRRRGAEILCSFEPILNRSVIEREAKTSSAVRSYALTITSTPSPHMTARLRSRACSSGQPKRPCDG